MWLHQGSAATSKSTAPGSNRHGPLNVLVGERNHAKSSGGDLVERHRQGCLIQRDDGAV